MSNKKVNSKFVTTMKYTTVVCITALISSISTGYVISSNDNKDKVESINFALSNIDNSAKDQLDYIKSKEEELKKKESKLDDTIEEYKKKEDKFETDLLELKKAQAKNKVGAKVSDEDSSKYQKLIGTLLTEDKSSLYYAVTKVSKSLDDIGDNVNLISDNKWKSTLSDNLADLNKVIKTVDSFDKDDVTSIHKASYVEILTAIDFYSKAIQDLTTGSENKEIDSILEGSSHMQEGAKHFQIAINIYSTELSSSKSISESSDDEKESNKKDSDKKDSKDDKEKKESN